MKLDFLKYTFVGFLGILLVLSCGKEEHTDPEGEHPPRLIEKIETILDGDTDNVNSYIRTFFYDENDNLERIHNTRDGSDYVVRYDNMGRVDSLVYEYEMQEPLFGTYIVVEYEDDRISKVSEFNYGGVVGLQISVNEIIYNGDGLPKEIINGYGTTDYNYKESITWTDSNPTNVKLYDEDDELIRETDFLYDDKPNFLKTNVTVLGEITYYAENNVINTKLTDYSGLIDPVCFDCDISYEYNGDDYPTKQGFVWNLVNEITYK